MFSALLARLELAFQSIKAAVEVHDLARQLYFELPSHRPGEVIDVWQPVRASGLERLTWQIYDYCAAITRLYAAYSLFVEDLVSAYLRMLPSLYELYESLPPSVKNQHRIGSAQILLKIGKAGPFRNFREDDVIRIVGDAVTGRQPYSLLEKAFFVENQRQNYRLDALARILGCLGIQNVGVRISAHEAMKAFLEQKRGGSTTFQGELSRFVQLRNEAAHTEVEELISTDEFKTIADFVWTLCTALAEVLETEVIARRFALGQLAQVGTVSEVYHGGFIVVVKAKPTPLSIGDQIAIASKRRVALSHVVSIQNFGRDLEAIDPVEGQEVGLGLDRQCGRGCVLAKVPPASEYAIELAAPAEEGLEERIEAAGGENIEDPLGTSQAGNE